MNVDRLGQGDIQYVVEKPCGATQHATRAWCWPTSRIFPWGTAQGFRMLLPPDELHTTLEYTWRTWHRTGTGLLITL